MLSQNQIGLTCSDGILLFYLFSLSHSCIDILYHGSDFGTCAKPIHVWLIISYLSLVGLRVPHYLKQFYAADSAAPSAETPRLSLKGLSKACLMVVWFALLPFFTIWTVIGSFWLHEVLESTPACLPPGSDPKFIIFWQVLCYLWILIYVVCVGIALVLRHRQRRAENDLREVETEDSRARWGTMASNWGLAPLLGLSAKEISALPAASSELEGFADKECSICLSAFQEGDSVRQLPKCGHAFHQACIDLWLLRQNNCPLCKGDVVAKSFVV